MGRKRTSQTHLPRHMLQRRGAYYHVTREGKQQRWLPLGRDFGEALRKWAELEAETRPALTVADLLAAYIVERTGERSEKTLHDYRLQAQTLGAVFGAMRPEDLRQHHVYTYLRKRGNVAGNRERDLLRAAFNWARNAGLFAGENPAAGMRARNREQPRTRYVTDAELASLAQASPPRFAVLLRWLYLTGMRISDALAFEIRMAREDGIHWREGKTGRERWVGWTPELEAVWKSATGARIGAQRVFLGQRGPYTLSGAESTLQRVRERAGVEDVRLHDLRRKAASDVSLEHAQELLGHSDGAVTKRHYRARIEPTKPVR